MTTSLSFDGLSRLTSLEHNPAGTAADQTFGFSYSPASQIITQSGTNASFDWTHGADYSNSYTVDGLNKYLTAAGANISHNDGRGNLTSDSSKTYAYDAANRLTSSRSKSSSVPLCAYLR